MKLVEIYNPNKQRFEDWDDLFEHLINACRPVLRQCATPLYRGMMIHNEDYDSTIYSSGTRPGTNVITNNAYKTAFDEWSVTKFGYKYLTNGLFTTGELRMAQQYGDLMVALPEGQFEYLWSPDVGDQIDMARTVPRDGSAEKEKMFDMFNAAGYRQDGLNQAISTGHEVIIRCKNYFHFDVERLKYWSKGEYTSLEEFWSDLRG